MPSDSITRVLFGVGIVVLVSTMFVRTVDPLIPQIGSGLGVNATTAALLSTAFALPYAMVQPLLGPIADMIGKTRMMFICLVLTSVGSLAGAFAPTFELLFLSRIVTGIACGGIFPASLALVADRVPFAGRQVALSRILFAGMTGNLLGASVAGVASDFIGWRGVFLAIALLGFAAFAVAFLMAGGFDERASGKVNLRAIPASYRAIFANPRAKICFSSVFLEGIFIFGVFPYIAFLLLQGGESRASIAGLVIAGFGVGGVVYTFAIAFLLRRLGERGVMRVGGVCIAIGLVVLALGFGWPVELAATVVMGFGFYMLHGSIQVHVSELAPSARGASLSVHSASFFFGQALGPIYYGIGLSHLGLYGTVAIGAVVILVVAAVVSRLLPQRAPTV